MSEPEIPERHRGLYDIWLEHPLDHLVSIKLVEELGLAEAKVAEQAAMLLIYEDAGRPDWIARQAATIQRLTTVVRLAAQENVGDMEMARVIKTMAIAALNKQESNG